MIKYCTYATNHYAARSVFVFDGYPETETHDMPGTKSIERARRKNSVVPLIFNLIRKSHLNQINFYRMKLTKKI